MSYQRLQLTLPQPLARRDEALLGARLRRHRRIAGALVENRTQLVVYYTGSPPSEWLQNELAPLWAVKAPLPAKRPAPPEAEGDHDFAHYRREAVMAAVGLAGLQVLRLAAPGVFASLQLARSVFVLFVARSFFLQGVQGLWRDRQPNAELLTATAVSASVLAGKPESSLTLLALSNVAEMLTTYTAERARKHISNMLRLDQQYVWKIDANGLETKVAIDKVGVGDRVGVHMGEKICVDGYVVEGSAAVDQSSITGEYIPAAKSCGDMVYAGTVLKNGYVEVLVEKVGDSTALARIVHMVEDAQARKAPVQGFAERMSAMLVPISFLSAALVYGATRDWQRVLNMLFIDFSCGLKLSTATAISAAIGKAASRGALVKGGNYIESMANIDTVVLDKTGTITLGKPQVVEVETVRGAQKKELLLLAASAEMHSAHPLASSILEHVTEQGWEVPPHDWTETVVAKGMRARIACTPDTDGGDVVIGSARFLEEEGIVLAGLVAEDQLNGDCNSVYVARNGVFMGRLLISDHIRPNFKKCINQLRRRGVDEVIMLTGDTERVARHVALQLDLDSYHANILPDEKAALVAKLQRRSQVLMVGDGINDAPALAFADVGVAMGGKRTDIAVESAAMTINSEDPLVLSEMVALSKDTMSVVRQNFAATIAVNSAAMLLGAIGRTSPMISALIHNAATVGVVMNSARILLRGRGPW